MGAHDRVQPGQDAYHYQVVARAIAQIAAQAPDPVPLEVLAAEARMSPDHFQRVFSRWAGVSPKRFGQYLVLDQARRLLAERSALLDVAMEAGLSGPGRLHDLFVTWEAMTPGAFARAGAGLEIAWSHVETPFGPAVAMATGRGLCGLGFALDRTIDAVRDDLAARWPAARLAKAPDRVLPMLRGVFERDSVVPRLHLIGGPFQLKVWEALLRLPEGRVASYGDIADALERPGAARAVGTAIGRNPVAWIVPCHRVLRGAGGLGGYRWGLKTKRAMLALEAARLEGDQGRLTPV